MDPKLFVKVAEAVARNPEMDEDEMTLCFDRAGFFEVLGYKSPGVDIRSQKAITDSDKRPDRFCLDDLGNVIFALESKKPGDPEFATVGDPSALKSLSQLWDRYVLPLRANFGVLTNGLRFILFERVGTNAIPKLDIVDLRTVTQTNADLVEKSLRKPERTFTSVEEVRAYVESDRYGGLRIDAALEEFYEAYRLAPESHFGGLLKSVYKLFKSLYHGGARDFTSVAFDFWSRSYATVPKEVPASWTAFEECHEVTILEFMFCLETSHLILARLILAKVCEDYSFPGLTGLRQQVLSFPTYREIVPPVAFPLIFSRLLLQMREALVESIFEEDIYSWWRDAVVELETMSPKELSEFRASDALLAFSQALRRVIFSISRFDFSTTREDLLGNLYQSYFDKETRKALGEFYTKVEIVDYILDQVNYSEGLSNKRLLDPCCGSGTFVISAARRYLRDADAMIPESPFKYCRILQELCVKPRIVALDIHPFAVVVTQVRLMVELIPFYLKALAEDREFLVRRLPVFRTDSLEIETRSTSRTIFTYGTNTVEISLRLPIRLSRDEFYEIKIAIPDKNIVFRHGIGDAVEYFNAVQAVFDTVKALASKNLYEADPSLLKTNLGRYLANKDLQELTTVFLEPTNQILLTIKALKYDFGDGRLVKSVEDVVLATILKNYFLYDFVVANPPYIRAFRGGEEARRKYRQLYTTPWSAFDTYAVFMERFVRWLDVGGAVGIITSNKYLVMDYGLHLRPFISNNCGIKQLIDLTGCPSAFDEPLVSACILVAARIGESVIEESKHSVIAREGMMLISLVKRDDLALLSVIGRDYSTRESRSSAELETYWTKQEELPSEDGRWEVFVTPPIRLVLEKIKRRTLRLGSEELGTVRGGVRGTDYATVERCVVEGPPSESTRAVRLLNVGSIGPFYSRWGKPVRYRWKEYLRPYLVFDNDLFSDALWQTFESKKVIVRGVAKRLTAFYDEEGAGFLRSIWAFLPNTGIDPDFVVALLNSDLYDFCHKARLRSARIPEGSYSYPQSFVESLPVRVPKSASERKIAERLAKASRELATLNALIHETRLFPESYLQSGIETEEEVFAPPANYDNREIAIGKNPAGYAVVTAGSRILHSTSQILNPTNRAYLLGAVSNARFRKDQEIRIRLPRSMATRDSMVSRLRDDKIRLRRGLARNYLTTINSLVNRYYGIVASDLKIVESVLAEMSISPETGDEDTEEQTEAS